MAATLTARCGSMGDLPRTSRGEFHRLSGMTSRQVGQYMAACGFADYEHLFKEHNISGDRLLQLTSEDLRDMGFVTVGDRLVMQQEIAGLRAGRRIAWRSDSFSSLENRRGSVASLRQELISSSDPLRDLEAAKPRKQRSHARSQRSQELQRTLRSKICHALRFTATREDAWMVHAVFKAWQSATRSRQAPPCEDLLGGKAQGACALAQLSVLRAWATAVAQERYEAELKAQEEKASVRSTAALSLLRNELRAIRWQGNRAARRGAQQRALLALLAPFSAWRQQSQEARHAARLRGELESVDHHTVAALSSARSQLKAARCLARRAAEAQTASRALLSVAPVFAAWNRQVQCASRRLRPGEVLLNSGQAAKRAQQQLQEARAQHAEQLEILEKEIAELRQQVSNARMAAAAAARREARVENIARKHELSAKRGEEIAALLACMKAWQGELMLSRTATMCSAAPLSGAVSAKGNLDVAAGQ